MMKVVSKTPHISAHFRMALSVVVLGYVLALGTSCKSSNMDSPEKEVTGTPVQKNKATQYPEELQVLHKNAMTYFLASAVDTLEVESLMERLKENGSWTSIDYTNKVRGGWPVKEHLEHVQLMAKAYQQPKSPFYHTNNLLKKIHLSLNYWLTNDFLSTNWWDQHIGVPELLAPTLLLMENELSPQQLDQALVLMNRAKIKMSGQNKVWLSGNVLLRSLLTRNVDSVAIASSSIQNELKIADGVGIKSDWSYHEHGAQLQFGNYGLSYLEDMIKWYTMVNGTPFQFATSKKEILRNYVLRGQQWVIYKEQMDISASGRQLFIDEQAKKYERLKACIAQMAMLDKEYSEDYEDAIDSETLSGNKHFWKSDFQVHRRKDFYFSVKMSSGRVVGTESVNRENIQGYYLGDGVSLLYVNNKENTNVAPFWDWKMLPGITVVQDTAALPIIKAWDFETNSTFVGGVTNGDNGIAALAYDRDGVQAHKSWFMFDDKIVCLGSGIDSDHESPLFTSVNQVFLNGRVLYSKDGSISDDLKPKQQLNPDWLLHDNTGYIFPKSKNVFVQTRFLEGSWNKVAKRYRPVILTESILKIWFDHGSRPKKATYEYILVPNANEEQMIGLQENFPFIINNQVDQQSVVRQDKSEGGIIFYKAGHTDVLDGIQTSQPCVLHYKKTDNGLELALSDPTQKLTELEIIIKGNYTGGFAQMMNDRTLLKITLPKGDYAGSSVSISLSKNK